jgi:hypothetical protein
MNNVKTKSLTIYEYFCQLQLEYVVAELRTKIYFRQEDKEYWKSICEKKKKNIENIVLKNNIPSIFDDPDLRNEYDYKVFLDKNFPIFTYRDEENRKKQEFWDYVNYYSKGSEFRCEIDGEIIIGVITYYEPFAKKIKIKVNNIEKPFYVNVDNCKRLF